MSGLPPGWGETRLADLADVRLGRQRSPKNHAGARMRPYLRAANVTWRGLDFTDVKEMNFSEQESDIYELRAGDVLVAEASGSASEVGKPALWKDEIDGCCFQNTLVRVRSLGPLPEYLCYFLLNEARSGRLGAAAPGVGIHHIGAARLSAWSVRVPPLNEQRRIVAAIEEQFSRLDAADKSLRRSEQRLEQLRAAVLAAAIDDAWRTEPLSSVLITLRNGIFVSRPAVDPPGVAIFRISAVRPLALDVDDVRYVPKIGTRYSDYLLSEGDLLFTRYSGNPEYVGACARVPHLPRPTLHPDKLIRVVVDRQRVEPAFLELACATGVTRAAIRARRKTTAGQVGIAGGQLKSIPIPLPPLDDQRLIVAEVQRQLSLIEAMHNAMAVAKRRSAALRRSILERAFRGELVPQDPSDEPASALLERIAAERATGEEATGRRPRRRATMQES